MSERRLLRSISHEGYEVASFVYPPGALFDWHQHGQDKCDAVVSGLLRIELENGLRFDLGPGDRLYVPRAVRHRAQVVGKETVLALDGTRW